MLALVLGLGGCADPDVHCRLLCADEADGRGPACPIGYLCVLAESGRVCQASGGPACARAPVEAGTSDLPPVGDQAGAEVMLDAPSGGSAEAPDQEGPGPPDGGSDGPTDAPLDLPGDLPAGGDADALGPDPKGDTGPVTFCHPRANCFTPGPDLGPRLVLWLDPSNLPAPGSPAPFWRDQSGRGHDAEAVAQFALPVARADGLDLAAGYGLVVRPAPELDVGSEDFVVSVVVRVAYSFSYFFHSEDEPTRRALGLQMIPRPPTFDLHPVASLGDYQVVADLAPALGDLRPHLLTLERVGTRLEFRIDGAPAAAPRTIPASLDGSTGRPLFLGTKTGAAAVPHLGAAVLVRGPVQEPERRALERFLLRAFAIAPPP